MSAPDGQEGGLPTFVNPLRVPCLRQTLLHALIGGTFMGSWRFYKCRESSPRHFQIAARVYHRAELTTVALLCLARAQGTM